MCAPVKRGRGGGDDDVCAVCVSQPRRIASKQEACRVTCQACLARGEVRWEERGSAKQRAGCSSSGAVSEGGAARSQDVVCAVCVVGEAFAGVEMVEVCL